MLLADYIEVVLSQNESLLNEANRFRQSINTSALSEGGSIEILTIPENILLSDLRY